MTETSLIAETRIAWDRIADGYDNYVTEHNLKLARHALDHVETRAGVRLLDVASGTGALSIPAARQGADVVAIDQAPEMIDRLGRRARAEDLQNLRAVVMDGEHLEFGDRSFDVTASQFGVMLFADLDAGLREMARVTRPGGTVLVVVFGGLPTDEEFLSFFLAAAQTVLGPGSVPRGDGPLAPFRLADRNVLADRLRDAGVADIHIVTVDHAIPLGPSFTGTALMTFIASSNPIGASLLGRLTGPQRSEVQTVLDGMLRERATSADPLLHNPVHIATGTPAVTS